MQKGIQDFCHSYFISDIIEIELSKIAFILVCILCVI